MKKRSFKFFGVVMALLCAFYFTTSSMTVEATTLSSSTIVEEDYDKDDAGSVNLYLTDEDGQESLYGELFFDRYVSTKTITLNQKVTSVRLEKASGYEVNVDCLTIDGKCPKGYERKLSVKDNDLIEIEDSTTFDISGKGELVISARAPKEVDSNKYAFKFPESNYTKDITKDSEFYTYTLDSNYGSFDNTVPSEDYQFLSEIVYPGSGHPVAPLNWYVSNDGDKLYFFTEVFSDNTFDHGNDYAAVHILQGDEVKTFAVHTTEENEYGQWQYTYTDSSEEYNWQHMLYQIEVPLDELDTSNKDLQIAFENYGTLSGPPPAYLIIKKTDENGNPLVGATFTIKDENDVLTPYLKNTTAVSDDNGYVIFQINTYGDYYHWYTSDSSGNNFGLLDANVAIEKAKESSKEYEWGPFEYDDGDIRYYYYPEEDGYDQELYAVSYNDYYSRYVYDFKNLEWMQQNESYYFTDILDLASLVLTETDAPAGYSIISPITTKTSDWNKNNDLYEFFHSDPYDLWGDYYLYNSTITNTAIGSLQITKTSTGATTPSDATFTITGPNDYSVTKKYSDFVDGVLTISDLPVGEYTVTEDTSSATVSGYTLEVTGNGSTATVSKGETTSITISNTYKEEVGSLKITKTSKGATTPNDATFTITGPNDYSATKKYSDFKDGVLTISDLPVGEYTVTEDTSSAAVSGYTLEVTGNGSSATVANNETASVTISNTYTEEKKVGTLKITKTSKGATTPSDATFTITGPNDYKVVKKYSDFVDGVLTLTDLPLGNYTITEDVNSAAVSGYTLTVTGNDSVAIINKDATSRITINNTYKPKENPKDDKKNENPKKSNTAKTGYSSHLNYWVSGFVASILGVVAIVAMKKRN